MLARVRHLSAGVLLLLAAGTVTAARPGPAAGTSPPAQGAAQGATQGANGTSQFAVLVGGVRVGTEIVDVSRANGMKISARSQLASPFDLVTHRFEMTYSSDWQPRQLVIEGVLGGQAIGLTTSFGLTTATNEMVQGTQRGSVTHQVTPRAMVLPANFFGAYEVLAARAASIPPGTSVPVYLAPDREISARMDRVSSRRISGPAGAAEFTQYELTFAQARGQAPVQIWTDARGRLARLAMPASSLLVIRDDLASVMMREEKVRNPGDEDVFIGAAGFNLAATVTKPSGAPPKAPAVILVGSAGQQDRDEVHYGVALFGQLAGALGQSGFLVVRYDKRGVGQSGGRVEHATLAEYAEDVAAIVDWLRKRKDVDGNRIAVIGHAQGGAVALLAAARQKRIAAVGLLAAPGATGREVTLEQQARVLARLNESQADRQAKIDLQRRVIDAAISGRGWEAIPPDVRRQADTPWFKSWLLFDPAATIRKLDQPLLVLHGSLDAEVPPSHAGTLSAISTARGKKGAEITTTVVVPRVNHLLVQAQTGDVEEYETLDRTISPEVTRAIAEWLQKVLKRSS